MLLLDQIFEIPILIDYHVSRSLNPKLVFLTVGLCMYVSIISTKKQITLEIANFEFYTLKNQRLKITRLEKAHFIKVNELKLTEVELF